MLSLTSAIRVAARKAANDAHKAQIALMKFLSDQARKDRVGDHVYVVGGAVRNFVIDRPIKDIDVVIDTVGLSERFRKKRDSEWFAKQLQRVIPAKTNLTTNQYGVSILTVKQDWILDGHNLNGEVIEIANARKESYGGEAGKGYKPDEVVPATIEEDLLRREFTFNTLLWRLQDLASGPEKAEIIDLTGCGLRDLNNMTMRCPRDPDVVFADDPTRMLRAIKFSTKYGFKIPDDLAASIRKNAAKMKQAPWEAIANIFINNVLNEPTAPKALKQMKSLGLLEVVAEMVQEQKPFASFMAKQLRNRNVALLLDLLDLGLTDPSPLAYLTRDQQERLREITVPMDSPDADAFAAVLAKPSVNNKTFITEFSLQGADRALPVQYAREALLENPDLADNPMALEKEIRDLFRSKGTRRTAAPKKYDHIDFTPPEGVANAAAKGLELRQKASPSNKGGLTSEEASKQGIGSGVQRAVNLKNRDTISPEVIKQMRGFLSRSEKSSEISAENKGTPWNDKGYVAWLLWGGDPAKAWTDKIIKQMEAADEKEKAKKAHLIVTAGENEPTNPKLWAKVQALAKGEQASMTHNGKTINGPNDGKGFTVFPSAYANGWASKVYGDLGGGWSKKASLIEAWGPTLREARGKAKKDVGHGGLDEWFSGHGGDEGEATWGDWVSISPVTKTLPSGKKPTNTRIALISIYNAWPNPPDHEDWRLTGVHGLLSSLTAYEWALVNDMIRSQERILVTDRGFDFNGYSVDADAIGELQAAGYLAEAEDGLIGLSDELVGKMQLYKTATNTPTFQKEKGKTACIIAAGQWDGHKCLFKNRDRNYTPKVKVYHVLKDGVEILYMKDEITGWCEGLNSSGIGIVNSALAVAKDEKEKRLTEEDAEGATLRDGKRILEALSKTSVDDAVESIQTFDKGLKGHTFVADTDRTVSLEATWEGHDYHVRQLANDKKHVRTNHGQYHQDAGYTEEDGDDYLSSLARRDQAMKVIREVDGPKDIAPAIYGKRRKDRSDPLNMVKLTDGMKSTSQIVLDLSDLVAYLYLLPDQIEFQGYESDLPEDYEPKISLEIYDYDPLGDDGEFEVKPVKLAASWGLTLEQEARVQRIYAKRAARIRMSTDWGPFMSKELVPGGLARGKDPGDFDKAQLDMGRKVEREHFEGSDLSDKEVDARAQEIAMDHLMELSDYYTRLKKMEQE